MKKISVQPGENRLPRKYPSMQTYKVGEEVILNKAVIRSLRNGDLVEYRKPRTKKEN